MVFNLSHCDFNIPVYTSIPFCFNFSIPFPATRGLGSSEPTNTLLIFFSIIMSVQGGVLP